jgi:3-oxoacyl-[acyl-carrier-protein] synthase III
MYAPSKVLTNDDLASMVETSDEWIRTRTGIESRHIVAENESTASMAIEAARAALQEADADPRAISLIIVATATPDHPMPSTACQVQHALSAIHAGAFDLNAGCSGFVYALTIGQQAIASGEHDLVLVIGADTMSRVIDWQDRNTCVLFGDGAGAVLLRASEGPNGVLATLLGSDGSGGDQLRIPAGGSAQPATHESVDNRLHYLQMDGRGVYRFATKVLPDAVSDVAKKAGLKIEDVALIVPHQANMRIIEAAAKRLKIEESRFVTNVHRYGNTSAGSVPIALCEALQEGRISPGQNLVFAGFGAGLTWAAVALKWGVSPVQPKAPFYHTWLRWSLYRWAGWRSRARRIHQRLTVLMIRIGNKLGRH